MLSDPPRRHPVLSGSVSLSGHAGVVSGKGWEAEMTPVPMLAFLAAQPLVVREKGRVEPVPQLDTAAEHELIWSSMLQRCVVLLLHASAAFDYCQRGRCLCY